MGFDSFEKTIVRSRFARVSEVRSLLQGLLFSFIYFSFGFSISPPLVRLPPHLASSFSEKSQPLPCRTLSPPPHKSPSSWVAKSDVAATLPPRPVAAPRSTSSQHGRCARGGSTMTPSCSSITYGCNIRMTPSQIATVTVPAKSHGHRDSFPPSDVSSQKQRPPLPLDVARPTVGCSSPSRGCSIVVAGHRGVATSCQRL